MIFLENVRGYASKIEKKGKLTVGTVSTSRKDKQSDEYVKSFWNAKFVKGKPTQGKIEIIKGMLTNEKAENGKYYVNLIVLEFNQESSNGFTPVDDFDECPF